MTLVFTLTPRASVHRTLEVLKINATNCSGVIETLSHSKHKYITAKSRTLTICFI